MKDKIGQDITVGCFIAYGHALGRCAGLRIGRVEAIQEEPEPRVTVLGADDDWNRKRPRLLTKRSTLLFPNRMVVVHNVPEKFTKLYEKDCTAMGSKHKWDQKDYPRTCTICGTSDDLFMDDDA